MKLIFIFALIVFGSLCNFNPAGAESPNDPLSSWNDNKTKKNIVSFVKGVTKEDSPYFVPVKERIAVFDNDGTLWSEQPIYFQLAFALDRIKIMAPQHPEWKEKEPFASILRGDMKALLASGEKGILELVTTTHTGISTDEFEQIVLDWIATAKHPKSGLLYTDMVFQPMLELLAYLRVNGFKTFIVSGGGVEFMRPWTERVYGIPPEQVIGSSAKLKFEIKEGVPTLIKLPAVAFIDDKEGKPLGIQSQIGRRPIFAAGNSDGDLQMLQFTTMSRGATDVTLRMAIIVHHTDGVREFAYDRNSSIGKLDKALDEAQQRGWTLVDVKKDWNRIYPDSR